MFMLQDFVCINALAKRVVFLWRNVLIYAGLFGGLRSISLKKALRMLLSTLRGTFFGVILGIWIFFNLKFIAEIEEISSKRALF